MAFTVVTNAHGPSPQPTAYRLPSCSLMTATGGGGQSGAKKMKTHLTVEFALVTDRG